MSTQPDGEKRDDAGDGGKAGKAGPLDGSRYDADELTTSAYDELRRLALVLAKRENPGQTIQASDLVQEAWFKLSKREGGAFNDRRHFYRAAAEAMRRILVDQARRKAALRHGGSREREDLIESKIMVPAPEGDDELFAVDEVLDRLEAEDEAKATLVKLRYFAGMTIAQASEALGISHATAERWWTYSRARLYQWLIGADSPEGDPER